MDVKKCFNNNWVAVLTLRDEYQSLNTVFCNILVAVYTVKLHFIHSTIDVFEDFFLIGMLILYIITQVEYIIGTKLSPCWSILDFWAINLEKSILVYFKQDFYCMYSLQK
jgi:hypothetical protein